MFMATQGPAAIYGSTITLTILNCIVVALRFYMRMIQAQGLKIDDWLTLPAMAINIGISVAMWIGVAKHAVGYPTPPMTASIAERSIAARTPLDQVSDIITINEQTFFIVYSMFTVSLALSKTSILFLYRRIFYLSHSWLDFFTIIIPFMIAIVVMFGIGISFSVIFACGTHFNYWWSTAGTALKDHCIDTQMLSYAQSVSDFIIDLIILAIPIPLIWRLHLSTKRKLGVIAIFLTAGVAVAASLIKMMWFLWENQTPWDPSWDQDLLASTFIFWTVMETHVALIAACLPTLRKCFGDGNILNSTWSSLRSTINGSSLHTIRSRTQIGKTSHESSSREEGNELPKQSA